MKTLKLVAGPVKDEVFYEDKWDFEKNDWIEGPVKPYKYYTIGLSDEDGMINDQPIEIEEFYSIMNGLDLKSTIFTCGCGVSGCAGYDDLWSVQKVDGLYVFTLIEDEHNDFKAAEEIADTSFTIDLEFEFANLFAFDEADRKGVYYDGLIGATDDELPPYATLRDHLVEYHKMRLDWKGSS